MSDLNDKLTELLDNYEYGPDWQHDGQSTEEEAQTDIKRMVVAIKQAFTDAGYKDMHELYAEVVYWPKKAMTGQEWYNCFEKELEIGLDLPEVMRIWVKACAKNAAGLE